MTIFQNLKNEPDLVSTLTVFEQALKYNKINCCRVAIVDEYDNNTRVAKVTIANKLTLSQNDDGSLVTQNYAPIYAKVLFFGWKDVGITHPVFPGSEGILLFNDREIESWYINGNINNLAYERAHDKTDAIFISGLLSLPNMIATLQDFLHFFYKDSYLKIGSEDVKLHTTNIEETYTDKKETYQTKKEEFTTKTETGNFVITGNITQTGNTAITGAVTVTGVTTSDGLADTTAATGTFTSQDGKLITVVDGIVKTITG